MTKKIPTQAPRTHLANNANVIQAKTKDLAAPCSLARRGCSAADWEEGGAVGSPVPEASGSLFPNSSPGAAFQSQCHYLFRPEKENMNNFKELVNEWYTDKLKSLSLSPGCLKCKAA